MISQSLHFAGIFFPETLLHSRFFIILATVVALNTIVYAAISLVHIFPKWFNPSWFRGRRFRRTTRSIYPDAPK
jgi:hypothetical protein